MARPPSPPGLLPHLKAEPEVAGLEHIMAPVVLYRVAAGREQFPGRRFQVLEDFGNLALVNLPGDLRIPGLGHHLGKDVPNLSDRPAYWIAVHRGVHAEQLVLAFRPVYVASLNIEAVEPEQGGVVPALDQNGYALVRVVLDVAVPELVLDDKRDGSGVESFPGTLLHRDEPP